VAAGPDAGREGREELPDGALAGHGEAAALGTGVRGIDEIHGPDPTDPP
jgi:hypothetical protein